MAFLSAFNNSAVLRLKWTRERLPAPTKKVRPPARCYAHANLSALTRGFSTKNNSFWSTPKR
jgi:hypothetical protein